MDPLLTQVECLVAPLLTKEGPGEVAFQNGVETPVSDADVLAMLLADKRSANTRRAYACDLRRFFLATYGASPDPQIVRQFLQLPTGKMVQVILRYKAALLQQRRAEATINRQLSAILSLVAFARRLGVTEANPGDQINTERVKAYRDTRGIGVDHARLLLAQPDHSTLKGVRDYALLLLLLENALRRAEIVGLTVADCDLEAAALWIVGKGRGTQRERVTLSPAAVAALRCYLQMSGHGNRPDAPLFISVSPAWCGRQLTADGLYKIVKELAEAAGLAGRLSPHRLRHTAITLALDASGGDVRKVRRLSRHARLETLQIYDDNRADLQGEMTNELSQLLSENSERR